MSLLESIPANLKVEFITTFVSKEGDTFLHTAGNQGNPDIIRILLETVPEVQRFEYIMAKGNMKFTALHWLAIHGHASGLRVLLGFVPLEQRLRVIASRDFELKTALHVAVWCGFAEIAKILIEAVPEEYRIGLINTQDRAYRKENITGRSALDYAIMREDFEHEDVAKVLLSFLPSEQRDKYFIDRKKHRLAELEKDRGSFKITVGGREEEIFDERKRNHDGEDGDSGAPASKVREEEQPKKSGSSCSVM
ncbi:MAG: ankyrin repeat domain-containing protein [Candidatus Babeliales bacterium]|jgi:ankyrin repeat protein